MDLIDIDEVLDLLELNEDKQLQQQQFDREQKERQQHQQHQHQIIHQPYEHNIYGGAGSSLTVNPSDNVQCDIAQPSKCPSSTSSSSSSISITNNVNVSGCVSIGGIGVTQKQSFVNVSNVFHSLNEYVNLEIQDLHSTTYTPTMSKSTINHQTGSSTIDDSVNVEQPSEFAQKHKTPINYNDECSSEPTSSYSSPYSNDIEEEEEKPKFAFEMSTTTSGASIITSSEGSPLSSNTTTTTSTSPSDDITSSASTSSTSSSLYTSSQHQNAIEAVDNQSKIGNNNNREKEVDQENVDNDIKNESKCDLKEVKELNELKESKELNELKVSKELNEIKESKELNELKEPKVLNELKESKVLNELKESKELNESNEPNDPKEPKQSKEPDQNNDIDSIVKPEPLLSSVSSYHINDEQISLSSASFSNGVINIDDETTSPLTRFSTSCSSPSFINPPSSSKNRTGAEHTKDINRFVDNRDNSNECQNRLPSDPEPDQCRRICDTGEQQPINGFERNITGKPIGFESTMDDVSDAELESYLQELELELSPSTFGQGNAVVRGTGAVVGSEETVQLPDLCTNDDCVEATVPATVGIESVSPVVVEEIKPVEMADKDEKNIQNADSFSQASTVEYVDARLQSDFEPQPVSVIDDFGQNVDVDNGAKAISIEEGAFALPVVSSMPDQPIQPESINVDEATVSGKPEEKPLQRPNFLPLPPKSDGLAIEQADCEPATESPAVALDTSNTKEPELEPPPPPHSTSLSASSSSSPSASLSSEDFTNPTNKSTIAVQQLGKVQPYWIPDNVTNCCMQCNTKFSLIKRRHHCRACGQVLCSTCCSLRAKLKYMNDTEARICVQCDTLLNRSDDDQATAAVEAGLGGWDTNLPINNSPSITECGSHFNANPNNPMEYCSLIPPHQQMTSNSSLNTNRSSIGTVGAVGGGAGTLGQVPISVMVPIGVLKREGAPSKLNRKEKNVIFSDGIRPGCDLTDLDTNWDIGGSTTPTTGNTTADLLTKTGANKRRLTDEQEQQKQRLKSKVKLPPIDQSNGSFIPRAADGLPPIYTETIRTEFRFVDAYNGVQLINQLQNQTVKFAIQRNLYVLVRIVKLTCCINKTVINFTTQGLHHVGQDEIVILLETDNSNKLPKDVFLYLNDVYRDAERGTQKITELGFSMSNQVNLLGSKEHGGFLYIRPTFQCMQNIIVPANPYLIGLLIHRWEVPWAKIFPLRLMLRLGAAYRYYPCPHVSVRERDSVYAEIAQTIINFLADFRAYSYTLPTIRGMYIHMEDRTTSVLIPRNRYDQIMKAINNYSDYILALGGNFSQTADGHLVCIQNIEAECSETHSYSTQAVNIQGRPRKVTGASFLILNGALKTTSGLTGKCSIVEDGLMVQILPDKMVSIHKALKEMKNIDIVCGPTGEGYASQTEMVTIKWVDDDVEFNIGVVSPIDNKSMAGIPSIRLHHGMEFSNSNHILRWTEVFIIQSDEDTSHVKDPIDISKLCGQIAQSSSTALVPFLDLLGASGFIKIGLRVTLHHDDVSYEAGSQTERLGPLYMNALDNELIPMLHRQSTTLQLDTPITVELIFHILDV